MKPPVAALALFGAVALAACHKETPAPPPAPVPSAPPPQATSAPRPPAPPVTGPAAPVADPSLGVAVELTPGEQSSTAQLTLGLQEFIYEKKRAPTDMAELSKFMNFRVVPIPPAGTRFVFDLKNKQVVAVRK